MNNPYRMFRAFCRSWKNNCKSGDLASRCRFHKPLHRVTLALAVHTSVEQTNQNYDLSPSRFNGMSIARTSEVCEFDSDLEPKNFQA